MRDDEWIEVSEHAATRWHQRAADVMIGPRVAWFEAAGVSVPTNARADEMRYHAVTDTVLIVNEGVLATVFAAEDAKPSIRQAIVRADRAEASGVSE